MIRNSTQTLIRRATGTAAILAVAIVLVVIYIRSSGKGNSVGAATSSATNAHTAQGQSVGPSTNRRRRSPSTERARGSSESSTSTSSAGPSGTFTGPVIQTPYGPVQVAVAEENGKITDVKALALPTEHPQSAFISERVGPLLRSEALEAQSAQINVVTGATFTSEGFASSLQKALLTAG
ncbi:MAG: FMN-binding protein [Solirubrobacteraceae bacterium]